MSAPTASHVLATRIGAEFQEESRNDHARLAIAMLKHLEKYRIDRDIACIEVTDSSSAPSIKYRK